MHVARVPRPGPRLRAGPGRPRLRAWRPALRHRRQPARGLYCGPARRPDAWAAPPCPSTRTPSPRSSAFVWNHAEVGGDRDRRPGAGRQGRRASRAELPALRRRHLRRSARACMRYQARLAQLLQPTCRRLGREVRADASGLLRGRDRQGRGRTTSPIVCYTSGTTGNPKGAMITHANAIGVGRDGFCAAGGACAPDDDYLGLPAHGVGGRRVLHALREPGRRVLHATARRARRRCSATCASWGPPLLPRAAADLGEHAHGGPGPRRRRHAAQAPRLQLLPAGRRARGDSARGRQAACRPGSPQRHGARRVLRLRPGARSARTPAGRSGRSPAALAARPGHLPVLPVHRREPRSRSTGRRRRPGSSRSSPDTEANPTSAGRPCAGIEVQHRRAGEVLVESCVDLQGLSQERGGDARGHRPRGLVPHGRRRDSSIRAGTWSSSTGPRMSARMHDGTPFAPQFIENKLKLQPVHPRGGVPSATSGRFVRGHGRHRHEHGRATGRSGRGLPYTSYMDLSQKVGGPRADP